MAGAADHFPDDTDALKAALLETRAPNSGAQALIDHLRLVIAKMLRMPRRISVWPAAIHTRIPDGSAIIVPPAP